MPYKATNLLIRQEVRLLLLGPRAAMLKARISVKRGARNTVRFPIEKETRESNSEDW